LKIFLKIFLIIILSEIFAYHSNTNSNSLNTDPGLNFKLGNEVIISEGFSLIENKNIGLITNNSGVLSDGVPFVDALAKKENVKVKKIFSPEHGFRGNDESGDYIDELTGIPVITLYGSKRKPSSGDLKDIDILIYDIQDVGARFYTYISTMYYCMESAYENNKKIIICDRPSVPYLDYADGFILDNNFKSFVGSLNIPVVYGMTCGELAKYINDEYFRGQCNLEVCEMKDYYRSSDYQNLSLYWVKPSPSMYFPTTAVMYSGTCLLEGTNFSEGRGSDMPFEYVGAPYCNSDLLKEELDSYYFDGVEFIKISFKPVSIASNSNPPKYIGEECSGIYIKVTNKKLVQPFKIGVALLISLKKLFPGFKWRNDNFIDKLAGTDKLRKMIDANKSYEEIINSYSSELKEFKDKRAKYLIYN